jgi:hypothetical protein
MIDDILLEIQNYNYTFIDDNFKMTVLKIINNLLPSLNSDDINILHNLTLVLIDEISMRYHFDKINGYNQWIQNNGRDISSLCLTLIPYIGNSDDSNYNKIQNLKDIIYKSNSNSIPSNVLNIDRKEALTKYFPYSNFTLGLLNKNNDNIFNLYENKQHTIYDCIENNFISMLETIKITNGKLFINWINTIPISDYKTSDIYKYSSIDILKGNLEIVRMEEIVVPLAF